MPSASGAGVTRKVGDVRRERVLELSEPGRRILNAAIPLWEGAQAQIKTQLGVDGARVFRETLRAV
ncbi:hypothetical protein NicSoilB8_46050 (plasmid) [Arthrobacter sp. NicSoilB8]|nr:hypothetical protein NicSoilB8_46050 [Arthrobacter sp. NicSoilB8]